MMTAPVQQQQRSSFAQAAAATIENLSIATFDDFDLRMTARKQDVSDNRSEQGTVSSNTAESKREARIVLILRVALICLWVVAAVLFSLKVYFYTSHQEDNEFRKQYFDYAAKVIASFRVNMERSLWMIDLMSVTYTSYALDQKLIWPFVTLPDFEIRAARASHLIGNGAAMAFSPLVTESQRGEWEAYSIAHQQWVTQAVTYRQEHPQLYQENDTSNNNNNYTNVTVSPVIWRIGPNNQPEPDNSTGVVFPVWQFTPLHVKNPFELNYNSISYPVAADAVNAVTQQNEAALSTFFTSDMFVQEPSSLRSVLFYPVFRDFDETNKSVVGVLNVEFLWQNFLRGLVPNNANGITAVLSNTCGQAYTFNIIGEDAVYMGSGDLHDTQFNDMEESIDLSSIQVPGLVKVETIETIGGCHNSLRLYPSETFRHSFYSHRPRTYTSIAAAIFLLAVLLFLVYDWLLKRRHRVLQREAVRSNAIVTSLFPSQVRDRLGRRFSYRMNQATEPARPKPARKVRLLSVGIQTNKNKLKTFLTSSAASSTRSNPDLYGSAPIADLFPHATVFFADIAGFTAWSSEREPTQVFILLETIYCAFDSLAKRYGVFKVETIGDCYMAVTGVPDPQENHAIVMTVFARACVKKMQKLTKQLEATLGPGTADLAIRVGLHSGPITAGVLRGEKSRFQLFGDTVNTASRMESNGLRNRIHLSEETAQLLVAAGKNHWITPRDDRVVAKGKGELKTYWLKDRATKPLNDDSGDEDADDCVDELLVLNEQSDHEPVMALDSLPYRNSGVWAEARWDEAQEALLMMDRNKLSRLVNWNVDVLLVCLKEIVASRQEYSTRIIKSLVHRDSGIDLHQLNPCDEVTEFFKFPSFEPNAAMRRKDPRTIEISSKIVGQLRKYVSTIASLYRNNPFHNFEHASHVAMSSNKLLQRIISPDDLDYQRDEDVSEEQQKIAIASDRHDRTFGIASDPLTQFAVVFSALIHDVDHTGITNMQLVQQKDPLAVQFRNQSVAEQNSIVIAWDLLMTDDFAELRRSIYATESEAKRFRHLVVNSVIATDLFDANLREFREKRWQKAFGEESESPCDTQLPQNAKKEDCVYRKATAVIEHIIQASDVAHTMQHWHIYQKWNEKLFEELCGSYRKGYSSIDPSLNWYQNELDFFDNYVIPLAKKLKECGVFGVSGDEYLNYAQENRKEWALKGEQIVEEMVTRFQLGEDNGAL